MMKTELTKINNSILYTDIYEKLVKEFNIRKKENKQFFPIVKQLCLVRWFNNFYLQIGELNSDIVMLFNYNKEIGMEYFCANKNEVKILIKHKYSNDAF